MKLSTKLLLNTSLVGLTMMFTGCVDDGDNGATGATALIKTTDEAAGDNCENGGTRIDIGLDDNANGVLDPSEIDGTEYICNGETGADGVDGADGEDGVDGVDGEDGNSTTGETGDTGETGEDGLSTLIRTSTLHEGDSHCFAGGTRIQAGVDDDDDGVLDGNEIDSTAYICNGLSASQEEAKCLLDAGGYQAIDINYHFDGIFFTRTWLDRNLGASRVANDDNDTAAFGDYYQWGRGADGHQVRNPLSDINDTLATTLDMNTSSDWYGKFIATNQYPGDWVGLSVDTAGSLRTQSWSTPYDATDNPNQVCPCGYVVPTYDDFDYIVYSETEELKMPKSGYRQFHDGNISFDDGSFSWTVTRDLYKVVTPSVNDDFYVGDPHIRNRGTGLPVRCIKPVPGIIVINGGGG